MRLQRRRDSRGLDDTIGVGVAFGPTNNFQWVVSNTIGGAPFCTKPRTIVCRCSGAAGQIARLCTLKTMTQRSDPSVPTASHSGAPFPRRTSIVVLSEKATRKVFRRLPSKT